ncbi:MAG: SRPBCC family protein [Rhodopirellula sp.]|nr:SRPBCC family protein [Rhodopirellula sp.]
MKLKDQIVIDATSDRVWRYVGSPDRWPLFHVKAGQCRRVRSPGGIIGAEYDMDFRLGSKFSATRCEILDLRVGRLIRLRSTLPARREGGPSIAACISYELEDLGRATRVRELLDLPIDGIPLLLRPLVWFLLRFGKPKGESSLVRLKRLVEKRDATALLPGAG